MLYKESKLELFDEVQSLLKEGAQVDQQDSEGNSLLMIATKYCHNDIVKILLEYKADVYLQDSSGKSSLMVASQDGHIDTVKILLEYSTKQTSTCRITADGPL